MKTTLLFLFVFIGAISCHLRDRAHKIYIGTALMANQLSNNQYRKIAGEEFNVMTCDNEMKWDNIEWVRGRYNYGPAEKLVQFAQQNRMKIRGHNLIWHRQTPPWLNQLDKNSLQQSMHARITNEVTHFKGRIFAWDVINEPMEEDGTLRKSIFYQHFGESYIADAFRLAHQADPNAKLYINDFSIEGRNRKSEGLYNLVKRLKAQGVPIHGVGFQGHMGSGYVPHELADTLRRFSQLDVDVAITEMDLGIHGPINAQTRHQQAIDYANVVKACLSVPRCVGVTIWEFVDKFSWIPNLAPLPWDNNYQPKEAVNAIYNALQ